MSESIPSDPDEQDPESGERVQRADGGVVTDEPRRLLGREATAEAAGTVGESGKASEAATTTPDATTTDDDVRLCWLDGDDAATLIESLSSETARSILTALHERPRTASELAEAADTSVQNVRHHLDNLRDADLAEVSDTRYSVKGREMDVYAPTDEQTVVAVGRETEESSLLDSLRSLLGGVAVLAAGSLLVQATFGGGGGGVTRVPDAVGGTAAQTGGVAPGLLFFAGGLLVAATVLALARRDRR
ncbi:ArsR/SmtB family transcription factor [Halobaculum sp. MBLA0147]|uniref:ArsR/SmtB family transcription factor n=1 Tax=Halobaculum sp. MBLA0147 TaxID=3079934 RepID=UPI00352375B4